MEKHVMCLCIYILYICCIVSQIIHMFYEKFLYSKYMNNSYNSIRRQTKMEKDLNRNFTKQDIQMATMFIK